MTEDEILKSLREEAELHTPDLKSKVLSEANFETAPKGDVLVRTKKWLLWAAAMFCVLALALSIGFYFINRNNGTGSFKIVMSINPGVEFTVEEGKVTLVRPLNRDAAVLLMDENLCGATPQEACLRFAELAEGKHLIGADGIRLHMEGEYGGMLNILFGSLTEKYTQYSVTDLDENSFTQLLAAYNEQDMGEFEDWLEREFDSRRESFETEIFVLLSEYERELNDLNTKDKAAVSAFNMKFLKLGEDLTFEDGDENKEELLREFKKLESKIDRNADRVLDELYKEFLDELEDIYEDYAEREFEGGKYYDDDDDDDDEEDDDDDD